jgi:hypothetical protein
MHGLWQSPWRFLSFGDGYVAAKHKANALLLTMTLEELILYWAAE